MNLKSENKIKIIFHIGFGKTGSSTLQSYLSCSSEHTRSKDRRKLLYCCLNKNGSIDYGKALKNRASNTHVKYISSVMSIKKIDNYEKIKKQLSLIVNEGFIPFFSQEDWGRRAKEFKETDFFNKIGCKVHVIVYVRPQVEWFNSAWWQWFAWKKDFENPGDVIKTWGVNFMSWAEMINRWKNVPGIEKISVRLHPKDTISDCLNVAGNFSPNKSFKKKNVGLSPLLIKIFKQYPHLRGVRNAETNAILSSVLQFEGKSPWIIDKYLAKKIIELTYSDNMKLKELLDDVSSKRMVNDSRWWSIEPYIDRKVWTEEDLKLNLDDYELIIEKAIPAIVNLSKRNLVQN